MDVKQTLINLHKRFPEMSLDDLFSILECIQDYSITYTPSTITTHNSEFITPLGTKIY